LHGSVKKVVKRGWSLGSIFLATFIYITFSSFGLVSLFIENKTPYSVGLSPLPLVSLLMCLDLLAKGAWLKRVNEKVKPILHWGGKSTMIGWFVGRYLIVQENVLMHTVE